MMEWKTDKEALEIVSMPRWEADKLYNAMVEAEKWRDAFSDLCQCLSNAGSYHGPTVGECITESLAKYSLTLDPAPEKAECEHEWTRQEQYYPLGNDVYFDCRKCGKYRSDVP